MTEEVLFEVELPFPLPTWNRILAMSIKERMKLRELIYAMCEDVFDGRGVSEYRLVSYDHMIRPKQPKEKKPIKGTTPAFLKRRSVRRR